MLCLTETWLKSSNKSNNQLIINEITPTGYLFEHISRISGRGGGVGLLYRKSLKLKKISLNKFKSFEAMGMAVLSSSVRISIFVIYRPPPSSTNNLSNAMFFEEFSTFLECFSTDPGSILLVGDFNFHVEDTSNVAAGQFLDLLRCFNLKQHVKEATYQGNHTLDLIITRTDDDIINNVFVKDPAISDHSAVFCNLMIKKPPFDKIVSKCRNLKGLDFLSFADQLSNSLLLTDPQNDLVGLVYQYESVLSSALDYHAPYKERIITLRPSAP